MERAVTQTVVYKHWWAVICVCELRDLAI